MLSCLLELRIVFFRIGQITGPQRRLCKTIQNRLALRRSAVRVLQDLHAVFIALVRLIDLTDHTERPRTLDTPPVDRIRCTGSAAKISALRACTYLFKFDFIFGLVHFFTSNSGFGALFSPPRVGIFSHNYE